MISNNSKVLFLKKKMVYYKNKASMIYQIMEFEKLIKEGNNLYMH